MPPERIERWRVSHLLGKGSFGQIYEGVNVDTNERVAIKMEPADCKHPQVRWEAKVYSAQKGIKPSILWFGTIANQIILVMEKLDCSLSFKPLPISLRSVARQMIDRIKGLHEAGYIHRDIKPENFLLKAETVYLIDMGLAKKYMTRDNKHIPYSENKRMVGTPRYASIHNQLGHEVSRRDDMESIAYVLIYLAKGRLPWQNLPKSDDPHAAILKTKQQTRITDLCESLPKSYLNLLEHAKSLRFDETPNYNMCTFWFQS